MWWFELQSKFVRSWLDSAEVATSAFAESNRQWSQAWRNAAAPQTFALFPFSFPMSAPFAPAFAGASFGLMPAPFGLFAQMFDWQRQWGALSWFGHPPTSLFAPTLPWANFWTQPPVQLTDLMSANYRTATGHAAAQILFAPFQPKPFVHSNWLSLPLPPIRGYLN